MNDKNDTKAAVKAVNKELTRTKYEYKCLAGSNINQMNVEGLDGWEAFAMMSGTTFFKREKLD